MATNATNANEAVEQNDVAVDVVANDLTHLGTDSLGYNHYHDRQRDRIVVTDATHDEYTREGSALVRRRLVAGAERIDDVVEQVTGADAVVQYLRYVAARAESRDWESVSVQFVDVEALIGEGI